MKTALISLTFAALFSGSPIAQAEAIYRCASSNGGVPEYINNSKMAQNRNCKIVEGGNVTVVQGTSVQQQQRAPVRVATATPSSPATRTDAGPEQRARDSDSRAILESELKKSETRLAEQQKEYNNGEPEKQGIEGRNYQRYLDRVAELKDSIARNQSDIAGIKRELARLPGTSTN
jgi:hypothetical protein